MTTWRLFSRPGFAKKSGNHINQSLQGDPIYWGWFIVGYSRFIGGHPTYIILHSDSPSFHSIPLNPHAWLLYPPLFVGNPYTHIPLKQGGPPSSNSRWISAQFLRTKQHQIAETTSHDANICKLYLHTSHDHMWYDRTISYQSKQTSTIEIHWIYRIQSAPIKSHGLLSWFLWTCPWWIY